MQYGVQGGGPSSLGRLVSAHPLLPAHIAVHLTRPSTAPAQHAHAHTPLSPPSLPTAGAGRAVPLLRTPQVGGIRRIIVPVELGYPNSSYKDKGPPPSTFAGQRALSFVLENRGMIDKVRATGRGGGQGRTQVRGRMACWCDRMFA